MATDHRLITLALLEVRPSQVRMMGRDTIDVLTLLNSEALNWQVERFACRRRLTWEEWQDVRQAWCKHYEAVLCQAPKDDWNAVTQAASQALREGAQYILVDYV